MDANFKKNFLKGSASAAIGTIASMAFHFLSIMLLTRHLAKADFGIYALTLVITYLLTIFGGLGLEYTLVKLISTGKKESRQNVLLPILILRGAALIITAVIFLTFSRFILHYFDESLNNYIWLISILFIITSYRDLLFNYLQGLNLFKSFAITQVSSAIARVSMIYIFLMFYKLSIEALIYIEIGTTTLSFLLLLLFSPMKGMLKFNHSTENYKNIIKFSFPLYVNNLLTFSYDRFSLFLVGIYLTPASVALFDVASRAPDALKRIFNSFTVVFFPNMSKLISEGRKEEGKQLMNRSITIISNIFCAIMIISFLFKDEIITILFSKNYIESSFAFSLLMFNFYLRALSTIMGYSLVSAGYSSVPMKANVVSSIISITGGIYLIPLYGIMGAVYSVIIMSIVAQFSYTWFLIKADLPANTYDYLKPLIILSSLLFIYFIMGYENLILKLLFLAVYILCSALFIRDVRRFSSRIYKLSIQKSISMFNF